MKHKCSTWGRGRGQPGRWRGGRGGRCAALGRRRLIYQKKLSKNIDLLSVGENKTAEKVKDADTFERSDIIPISCVWRIKFSLLQTSSFLWRFREKYWSRSLYWPIKYWRTSFWTLPFRQFKSRPESSYFYTSPWTLCWNSPCFSICSSLYIRSWPLHIFRDLLQQQSIE